MKTEGKAAKSVVISTVTLVADMVIDLFLIYGIAGAPRLGANGSAYSTVAVELIALIWCIAESYRGESTHPDWEGFRWTSAEVRKDFFDIALPMLVFSAFYVCAYSINTIVVCGIFPAGGDAKYDAVSVFFASWCFSLPLALLGTFVFKWPVMVVYILMCADEIVKLPFIYPRYQKFLWLKNLTRES